MSVRVCVWECTWVRERGEQGRKEWMRNRYSQSTGFIHKHMHTFTHADTTTYASETKRASARKRARDRRASKIGCVIKLALCTYSLRVCSGVDFSGVPCKHMYYTGGIQIDVHVCTFVAAVNCRFCQNVQYRLYRVRAKVYTPNDLSPHRITGENYMKFRFRFVPSKEWFLSL